MKEAALNYRSLETRDLSVDSEGGVKIRGYASVFGALSDPIPMMTRSGLPAMVREKFSPGAFTKTLQESDQRAFFNHDSKVLLGRKSNNTLTLAEDENGLSFAITPPDTQTVRDLVLEPMRRGDMNQMSIGFVPVSKRDSWEQVDGFPVVTRNEVKLMEISIVAVPAYPQTTAQLSRAMEDLEEIEQFPALALTLLKAERGLDLTDPDRAVMQQLIETITRYVTPGAIAAAHLTEEEAKPPMDFMETLRRRFMRVACLAQL